MADRRVLISAGALADALGSTTPPVVLDVRWALGQADGREQYEEAHIPGAVFVDLERELAAPPNPAQGGRHPLPELGSLERAARRWGIDDASSVVAYDAVGNLSAARAWWLLRWGGLDRVRLLDGGLGAWRRAGFALESGTVEPRAGSVRLRGGALPTIDAVASASFPAHGVLLDARAAERFRGEVEPADPRAGHIPGAVSAPTAGNLTADGTFLDAADLRSRFSSLGVTAERPAAVYCGSGVTAAHEIAALAIAGYTAALYPGSWSEWCADPERPAATGD